MHVIPITRYPVDFSLPETHVAMLENTWKYQLFLDVLKAVTPGREVLDIGTGSAILSLLAVASGARRVIAIDRPKVVSFARAVLADFPQAARRIQLLEGDFLSLDKPPSNNINVVVSETIGYLAYEEDIATIMAHARALIGEGATLVPRSLRLSLYPVTGETYLNREKKPFLTLVPPEPVVVRVRSEPPGHLLGTELPETFRWTVKFTKDQLITGLACQFTSLLAPDIVLSNKEALGWPQYVIPLFTPVMAHPGEILEVLLKIRRKIGVYEVQVYATIDTRTIYDNRWETFTVTALTAWNSKTNQDVIGAVKELLRRLGLLSQLMEK